MNKQDYLDQYEADSKAEKKATRKAQFWHIVGECVPTAITGYWIGYALGILFVWYCIIWPLVRFFWGIIAGATVPADFGTYNGSPY